MSNIMPRTQHGITVQSLFTITPMVSDAHIADSHDDNAEQLSCDMMTN